MESGEALGTGKVLFVLLKLAALAGLTVTLALVSTLYSTTPTGRLGVGTRVLWVAVAAGVLFGVGAFAPRWDKALTLGVLGVSLLAPALLLGLQLSTWKKERALRREQEAVLDQVLAPGHVAELAAFLQAPERVSGGAALRPSDVERIGRELALLAPEVSRAQHLTERLLLGVELRPNARSGTTLLSPEVIEALCRLYPSLQARSGFAPERAPFYLRQRARAVSRVAELGWGPWQEEIGREHPGFQQLTESRSFARLAFDTLFPGPVAAPPAVSRSLGSLPMLVLMEVNVRFFPPAGAGALEGPADSVRRAGAETREALALLRSRGVDFTAEELRDEGLQEFLVSLGQTP